VRRFLELILGVWKQCQNCGGTGEKNGKQCTACKGEGGIDTAKI
jgi:DnaJ-class molecular chaperone